MAVDNSNLNKKTYNDISKDLGPISKEEVDYYENLK